MLKKEFSDKGSSVETTSFSEYSSTDDQQDEMTELFSEMNKLLQGKNTDNEACNNVKKQSHFVDKDWFFNNAERFTKKESVNKLGMELVHKEENTGVKKTKSDETEPKMDEKVRKERKRMRRIKKEWGTVGVMLQRELDMYYILPDDAQKNGKRSRKSP